MTTTLTTHEVEALKFLQQKEFARTRPGVFECQTADGERQEFVVKFSGQLKERILCEAFASQLGRACGLPIPKIAAVTIPDNLIPVIPNRDIRNLIGDNVGPHFGSYNMTGGFTTVPIDYRVPEKLDELSLKIFIFDMLIKNTDRRSGIGTNEPKPNMLYNGDELFLIDHELSLSFIYGEPPEDPWNLRADRWPIKHIFYNHLHKYVNEKGEAMEEILDVNMTPIREGLNRLKEVEVSLPDEWRKPSAIKKITEHFMRHRDNWGKFKRGIWEVLI